jgi:hypothetical protein
VVDLDVYSSPGHNPDHDRAWAGFMAASRKELLRWLA